MPRYAAKVDSSQAEIVRCLRAVGATVQTLHKQGAGCPDLLVGHRGVNYLLEAKPPKGGTRIRKDPRGDAQRAFHETWRGQVAIVHTCEEALRVIDAVKGA